MRAIQFSLSSAAMSGGLPWASVSMHVVKSRRIIWQLNEKRHNSLHSQFCTIPCGDAVVTPSLSRDLHLRSCVEARALSPAQKWVGLPAWRTNPLNDLRVWGKRGPTSARNEFEDIASSVAKKSNVAFDVFQLHWEKLRGLEARVEELNFGPGGASLAEWGAMVLRTADPVEKAVLTHHAYRLWCNGELFLGDAEAPDSPARPEKPQLVHPWKIPPPSGTILTPSAHALHILAHIELNAIDLAWDTVVRFSSANEELDRQFFADFAHVADDESRHCLWCLQRLAEMGFSYGDMPAHNLLLADCQKTSRSVMARLAIIPMMQEARGLDAGPRLFDRLTGNGDARSASISKRIAEEEVAHVAVGVAWFVDVCRRLGLDPADRFQGLLKESDLELRGPFNHAARSLAGLPRDWYDSSYDPSAAAVDISATANQREPKVANRSRERSMQVIKQQAQPPSECHVDGKSNTGSNVRMDGSRLPEVYARLAMVVSMEQENADA